MTIAFIPVRGGSKTIPGKNIKPICGRPLIHWVMDAAAGCTHISRVYVATDAPAIAETARAYGSEKVITVTRGADTATDTASTESAMLEFARTVEFDDIVLIQATSPLLERQHLEDGISLYRSSGADSLISVVRQKRFLWEPHPHGAIPINYDPRHRPRRQDFNGYLVENGAFYVTTRAGLLASGCRLSGKVALYEMPDQTYFELDEPTDWTIVEGLLRTRLPQPAPLAASPPLRVRLFVTDVDGVMTDGGMYYSESGDELKKFNTRDGKAFELLRERGIVTAIITGENTRIVERRARKLKIDHVLQGVIDKGQALGALCQSLNISLADVVYIGDDVNDLDALRMAGFAFSPQDGRTEAKAVARYICASRGGQGCVREVAEIVLAEKIFREDQPRA